MTQEMIRRASTYPIPTPRALTNLDEPLNRYGQMRKEYLQQHHSGIYAGLLMNGSLNRHCLILQHQAEEMADQLAADLAFGSINPDTPLHQWPDPAAIPEDVAALAEQVVLSRVIHSF